MDSIEEALSAIFIGLVVAEFLCKTGRVLQAIEVYREYLIILHSQVLAIDGSLANTMFRALYMKITFAYVYIKDYTSTEKTVMTPLKKDGYIYSWQQYFRYKVSSWRPGNFTNQQSKHHENDRKHTRPGTMLQKPRNNVAIA